MDKFRRETVIGIYQSTGIFVGKENWVKLVMFIDILAMQLNSFTNLKPIQCNQENYVYFILTILMTKFCNKCKNIVSSVQRLCSKISVQYEQ